MSERLDKVVAARTSLSRKDAERAVRRGRVTVDGVIVRDGAAHVGAEAVVALDDEVLAVPAILLAWHKPVGVVSTMEDPWGRADLAGAVPAAAGTGWHPVGRLDKDTSGLLLLSRDGALTQWMLHPRRALPREYEAVVDPPPAADLGARLAAGVTTAEGIVTAELVAADGDRVRLVVREGKHRMVRRMLANAGHPVLALHRLRYGPYALGDLGEGEVRVVDPAAVAP